MQEAMTFVRAAADIANGASLAADALRDVCRIEAARLRVAEAAGSGAKTQMSEPEWSSSEPARCPLVVQPIETCRVWYDLSPLFGGTRGETLELPPSVPPAVYAIYPRGERATVAAARITDAHLALLRLCDGTTPVIAFTERLFGRPGAPFAIEKSLQDLATAGIVRWVSMAPRPTPVLVEDLAY